MKGKPATYNKLSIGKGGSKAKNRILQKGLASHYFIVIKYIIIFQNKRLIDFKPLTKKRTKPLTGRFVECRRVKPETVAANQTLNFQPQLNTLGTFPDRGYAA